MQRADQPARFLIPTAQNDPSKAEIPATTADDARASQSLGFPPRTGLPPEAGGVPPQLPDMNGLLNQATRVPFWHMLGGRYGYDSTFANDPAIGGHPLGAVLPSADGSGEFYSTTNDNTANPDTSGLDWVPGYHYGGTALTVAGGTVTLSPAQAAKTYITLAGTLTSNVVIVVPAWVYGWTFINNTSGTFSATVKTPTGSGANVAQNGAPSIIQCDGVNCSLLAPNIGTATSSGQAMTFGQAAGRLLNVVRFTASGTYTPSANTKTIIVELQAAGGGGGGGGAQSPTLGAAGGGGGGGAFVRARISTTGSAVPVTIGTGGAGGSIVPSATGGTGGDSVFGTFITARGGRGGGQLSTQSGIPNALGGGTTQGVTVAPGVQVLNIIEGSRGGYAFVFSTTAVFGGIGGATGSSFTSRLDVSSSSQLNVGVGGWGVTLPTGSAAQTGAAGSDGCCIVYEYS